MLKVLQQDQIRMADRATIAREPISSTDLMERASRIFSDWFQQHYPPNKLVLVVAGTGNNGGDGLAVARHLYHAGYTVVVNIIKLSEPGSDDFLINLERLDRLRIAKTEVINPADLFEADRETIVVDAMLGSGLNRSLDGLAAAVVDKLNQSGATLVSIDVPSGLNADGPTTGPCIRAANCLSFEVPKKALLLPDSQEYCGTWSVLPIGWLPSASGELPCREFLVQHQDLADVFPHRLRFSHKSQFGHVMVAGGSNGMRGAAWLCALAALRAGTGLSSCWLTGSGPDYCPGAPEIMHPEHPELLLSGAIVAAGPGMGKSEKARIQLGRILEEATLPPVLDADAINLLADDPSMLKLVPPGSVLTPHPGEFRRLFGESANGFERLEKLKQAAHQLNSVIVLKGAYSCTASPDGTLYFNPSGNPGMATAGSGDVLTGVIAALRAQGLSPLEAAWAGTCWHGLAGDRAAVIRGEAGLLARDIVDELPVVRKVLGGFSAHPKLPGVTDGQTHFSKP